MKSAIEIETLEVRYRRSWRAAERNAVRRLTLRVREGEVVGFIGPNGAGKSSTINCLMGFRRPSAGRTSLFGVPSSDPKSRRQVGYLPEVALYYPWLTAREALQMYGELQELEPAVLRHRAEALLERVGLLGRDREQLRGYSKGMLQRLGIAQALLGQPRLLVLDEVFSGLDPIGRRDVRALLLEQRAAGVTTFFSSHELTEVAQLCDRIIVVHHGEVVAEEDLSTLADRLKRFTVEADPPACGALPPVPGHLVRGHWRAELESAEAQRATAQALTAAGYTRVTCGEQGGDLEAYFIATVGRELN